MTTLWVDSRTGSKELLPALRKQRLTAELTVLDAADFAFEGLGPSGPMQIGVERKTLGDLISSLRSGRLQGRSADERSQLDRLHKAYDIVWLLVEGFYTTDRQGNFVTERGHKHVPGGYSEDSLNKALLSLELRGGMHIKQTTSMHQSAVWLASLFHSFTDKKWSAHTTLHTPMRRETIVPLSTFRNIVLNLPGVGVAVSLAVERYCSMPTVDGHPSLEILLGMTENHWTNLEIASPTGSRKLGYAKAVRIVEAVRKLR